MHFGIFKIEGTVCQLRGIHISYDLLDAKIRLRFEGIARCKDIVVYNAFIAALLVEVTNGIAVFISACGIKNNVNRRFFLDLQLTLICCDL